MSVDDLRRQASGKVITSRPKVGGRMMWFHYDHGWSVSCEGHETKDEANSTCCGDYHKDLHRCAECACGICWACHEVLACMVHEPFFRDQFKENP